MNHVKFSGDQFFPVITRFFEVGHFVLAINFLKIVHVVHISFVLLDIGLQCRHVVRHAEQHPTSVEKLDVNMVEGAAIEPVITGEVERFLRGAGAFYGHGRLRKERLPASQTLHQFPGVGSQVKPVVGGYAILAQRILQAFDAFPVQLQTRTDDKLVVFDAAAISQLNFIVFWCETDNRLLNPGHILGDQRGCSALCGFSAENPTANHCPARLIIVFSGRVDECDAEATVSFL